MPWLLVDLALVFVALALLGLSALQLWRKVKGTVRAGATIPERLEVVGAHGAALSARLEPRPAVRHPPNPRRER